MLELREKRYSKMQIMQELGIGKNAVVDIIQRLADEGKITSTRLIKKPEKIIRKNQSRDDIQELFSSEYTIVEVAKILRTSISNVFDYVYELISEGKLDKNVIVLKRKVSLAEVEQRIIALLEQGKNRQLISEELQLSYNEINPIISRLIKEKRVSPIRKNNKETLKAAREKQMAYELMKQGKTDIEIMNATTLRQVDVIKMRKEYFSKQNEAEAER